MNNTKWGYVGEDYRMYDHSVGQNEQGIPQTYQNFGNQSNQIWNHQYVHGGYNSGYPILQNQNASVSSGNYNPQGNQTWNHQFVYGGCNSGYPILQNQNVSVSLGNYHQHENRTYDHSQLGHYGHGNFYSEGSHSQWSQLYQFPQYQNTYMVQHPDNALNSYPGSWDQQSEYSVRAVENQNMVSNNCHDTPSCSIDTAPSELESLTQTITDEHDPNASTGTRSIEIDENTCEQGTEQDENEHNVLTESMIIKPKYKIGCDNSVMFVKTSDCKSAKKHCCPFCDKLYSKLTTHMEVKHKTEPDVQRFSSLSKGSECRRLILDSLRKTGMANWNMNSALNKNEMITCRRPNIKFGNDGPRYKICPYCNGFYTRLSLRLHVNYKCPLRPIVKDEKKKGERAITALSTSVESRYLQSASPALQKVYKKFRDDALVRSLKFDWLITVYGNRQAAKYTRLKSPQMIKGRLRLIARFLRELKRIEPEVTDLATMYHPMYFDRVVEAIQAVARFDADNSEYGAPCTASSCVTVIKQIGVMLIAEYIKKDKEELERLTRKFMILYEGIHDMINKTVNENQSKKNRRKVIILPSLDDIKRLNQYIQSESSDCYNDLSKSFDYNKWLYLSKLTMISILIYNRKRVGDTESITLDDFKCREAMNETTNQQLFESLSTEAKEVARCYSRMRVRGKKNRTVPVLLNQSMEKSLNLIISHREEAGIVPKNDHLFALPPSSIENIIVINAGVTLKSFAKLSGAKNPESINATNLRKQLATMCVSLKLNDAEVADVADFMGHAELVHRNNYRQNTIDRQVVKMSQWLEVALGNVISMHTEQTPNIEKRQKGMKLLELLKAALGEEDSSDNENGVRSAEISDVPNKPASARKSKQSSGVLNKPAVARKGKQSLDVLKKPASARKSKQSSVVLNKPASARKSKQSSVVLKKPAAARKGKQSSDVLMKRKFRLAETNE